MSAISRLVGNFMIEIFFRTIQKGIGECPFSPWLAGTIRASKPWIMSLTNRLSYSLMLYV